jgi:hypothetical protein
LALSGYRQSGHLGHYLALLPNTLLPVLALLVSLLLLVFPTGTWLSTRWRWLGWGLVLNTAFLAPAGLADPAPYANGVQFTNPLNPTVLGVLSLGRLGDDRITLLRFLLVMIGFVVGGLAVVLRWRRAHDQERQQIKWLGLIASVLVGATVGVIVVGVSMGNFWHPLSLLFVLIGVVSFTFGVPVVIDLAILRYRLFDVDILIRQTVLYSTLTVILVLVYIGSIVVLQGLFRALTGQTHEVAIIGSTLTSVALFQPLRSRLQASIDRRFYRQHYDAARTLAVFGSRLRDEVDLLAIRHELIAVVQETMQPASISLWIRPDHLPQRADTRPDRK